MRFKGTVLELNKRKNLSAFEVNPGQSKPHISKILQWFEGTEHQEDNWSTLCKGILQENFP